MKIFGIGLSKTGTTSLASALEILGYSTRDYPGLTRYVAGDLSCIDPQLLAQHEALTDTPIPSFYRELDQHYPGSKFILTVRDMEGWLLSCKKQFTPKLADKQNIAHNGLFMDLYGTAVFDDDLFRQGYQRFVAGVKHHFKDRPADLLVLDVAGGDGWDALCAFLGKPIPDLPFPKANVTRIRWMDLQELVSIAKEAGQELLRSHRSIAPAASAGSAAPSLIPALVRKTMASLRGGRDGMLDSVTASAQRVLTQRLKRLNGDIPLVSRQTAAVAPAERGRWNHFWIIDPLDGESAFGTSEGEFSINIALIEDQRPIAGVVHAPLSGITYFAMVGKGAFKSVGDGSALRLAGFARSPTELDEVDLTRPASLALTMCRLIEAAPGTMASPVDKSMEWHSAAPQAIARLAARRVVVLDGGGGGVGGETELAYNKADWSNPRIRVA